MFKKSRIGIIASVMAAIIVLLFGTLAVILGTSYAQMNTDNRRMLEQYGREYRLDGGDAGVAPNVSSAAGAGDDANDGSARGNDAMQSGSAPQENGGGQGAAAPPDISGAGDAPADSAAHPKPDDTPPEALHKFDVSTFYSVAVDGNGNVLRVENESGALYSDETLEEYADGIIDGDAETGRIKSLTYMKIEKDGYTLVAFIDNAIMQGGMATVFRNTLIFGGISVIAVFIASVFLAGRIVAPLEESFRRQKQFISDAGHELKTPVSVVGANAELLAREIGENRWLENIRYENERMGSLVRQLLVLARTENVAPQTERLDLSRLTAGELLPFESVAYESGLEFTSDIADGLHVDGDAGRLKQLVSILIDNAIRHSEQGKTVDVVLSAEHGSARLSVTNDGAEIPPEQQKQIFERFYRVDSARGDDGHFGLGLAIAKAIVESHKGRITVSCHDGKVEFSVLLPLTRSGEN